MIRQNLFRGPHQRRSKQGQPNREVTKIHSNCNSNNAMQITSPNIITVAALITDKGGEPDRSSKAPIKINTITKGLTLNNNSSSSSSRIAAQIPDTTRVGDLTALGRMTLGRLYEPSSSCNSSTNQRERPRVVIGGVGGGGGGGGGLFDILLNLRRRNTKAKVG